MTETAKTAKNNLCDVADKLGIILEKLALISESAPFLYPGHGFTDASMAGLGHMLESIREDAVAADKLLDTAREGLAA